MQSEIAKLDRGCAQKEHIKYASIDVPGMDLAINVSASLTPQERQMVIREAIHKFPNVWEVTKSQVSYPKGSIHEHPIPTNPKNPEWYVKAYHQSPGKQKFLHDYADDLYKHGIIEDADRRCCITQESRSALAEGSVSSPPPFAAILPWILRRVHQTIAVPGCPILS